MKPIVLKMSAFGPYPESEIVDFENGLKDKKMFLIHGSTGSGKTSILDGICFALYGELSVKSRNSSSVRSDFADEKTVTSVLFTFSIDGSKYRIERQPRQTRAKTRGSGVTTYEADAVIYKIDDNGDETPLAHGVTKANEVVSKIIGFTSEQFRQVIILPQGEFKKVLEASTSDRTKILADLFETASFDNFEKFVKEKSDIIRNRLRELEGLIREILSGNGAESISDIENIIQSEKDAVLSNEKKIVEFNNILKTKTEQFNKFDNDNKLLAEMENAFSEYNMLFSQKSVYEKKEIALKLGNDILNLSPYEEQLTVQKKQLGEYNDSINKCGNDILSNKKELDEAEKNISMLKSGIREIEDKKIKLEKIKSVIDDIPVLEGLRQKIRSCEKEIAECEESVFSKNKALEDCRNAVSNLKGMLIDDVKEANLERKNNLSNRISDIEKKIEMINQSVSIADEMKSVNESLNIYLNREKDCTETIICLEGLLEEKNNESIKHSAALLAEKLAAGMPCPVCGSKDHPFPAVFVSEDNIESEIKNIKNRIKSEREAFESNGRLVTEKKSLLESLKSKYEVITAFSGDDNDKEKLADELKNKSDELKAVSSYLMEYSKNSQLLLDRESDMERHRVKVEEEKERCADLKIRLVNLNGEFAGLNNKLINAGLSECSDPESEMSKLAGEILHYEKNMEMLIGKEKTLISNDARLRGCFDESRKAMGELEGAYRKLNDEFLQKINKIGLKDKRDYLDNKLSEESLRKIESDIKFFNDNLKLKEGVYLRLKEQCREMKKTDTGSLEGEIRDISESISVLTAERGASSNKIEKLNAGLERLRFLEKDKSAAEREWGMLDSIYKVLSGKTGKIPFKSYMLITILDEVLEMSNRRLKVMSKGRYFFVRGDEVEGRGFQGLNITVYDAETGKTRAVTTLSGGEGFVASLSLAMGLADVIQAYCGGREMDTIFIDEGFGSLDPDSLDKAIKTLTEINSSGRLVGIISHVEELKTRFEECRLEVMKTGRGSKTKFHVF